MEKKKAGLPEENEIVLCTVTAIHYHSVFAKLDEYENKSGMIHISEISPGRIRNIRDFVKEGKKVVCKVLRVHQDRGHIDLSLRRVSEAQKRIKAMNLKQEQLSQKILEQAAGQLKKDPSAFYDEIAKKVEEVYNSLFIAFEEIVAGNFALESVGIDKKSADVITALVTQRIKPPSVVIKGAFTLKSYASNGVELVKEALNKGIEAGGESVVLYYKGAGTYHLEVVAPTYKEAEPILEKVTTTVMSHMEKHGGEAAFARAQK